MTSGQATNHTSVLLLWLLAMLKSAEIVATTERSNARVMQSMAGQRGRNAIAYRLAMRRIQN